MLAYYNTIATKMDVYCVEKELLRMAVAELLQDEGFNLPTLPATTAVKCAKGFLEWLTVNPISAVVFERNILHKLEGCFRTYRSVQVGREKMWESFYKLTASDSFGKMWKQLLISINIEPTPIFYQYVTDRLMNTLIKEKFPVKPVADKEIKSLDYEELNAVRYVAGYVLRALTKKMLRSAHPLKEEMVDCLDEMIERNSEDGI